MKMADSQKIRVVGQMSGTSLDGIDLADCEFWQNHDLKWCFEIHNAVTLPYPDEWAAALVNAHMLNGEQLMLLHKRYGVYMGETIKQHFDISVIHLVAVHGHTVFHQPDLHFTFQMGDGAAVAAVLRKPVVSDFRSLDVALGGQGAPLVPMGDELLFSEYDFCLNLGGFANISYKRNGVRIAFDVCPANMMLNEVAAWLGAKYDNNGQMARRGKVIPQLLDILNKWDFYAQLPPKSLGRENYQQFVLPVIKQFSAFPEDILHTACVHIGMQIGRSTEKQIAGKILITGGGAYNSFLIEQIQSHMKHEVIIPESRIVEFKEALIFAFLGMLRFQSKENTLSSVTGASKNSSGGAIYLA